MKEHPWACRNISYICQREDEDSFECFHILSTKEYYACLFYSKIYPQVYHHPSRFNWEWKWRSCKGPWDLSGSSTAFTDEQELLVNAH